MKLNAHLNILTLALNRLILNVDLVKKRLWHHNCLRVYRENTCVPSVIKVSSMQEVSTGICSCTPDNTSFIVMLAENDFQIPQNIQNILKFIRV